MQPDPTPDLDELLAECDECGAEMMRAAEAIREQMPESNYRRTLIIGNERMANAHANAAKAIRSLLRAARERDELRVRAEKAEARAKELETRSSPSEQPMWSSGEGNKYPGDEYGPRIPSPEDIEAAKDALREAIPHLPDEERESVADRCRQALAKLEGRL